jgi:uncharacterized protein YdaU (DUF1376 family)
MSYRDRQWMPFYCEDFKMDTLELGCDEIGVYFVMIMLAWTRGDGSVSGDMAELKKHLQRCFRPGSFHGLTFNRIVPKLLHKYFHRRDDGRYYQTRVEKELRIARELSKKRSRISQERWAKYNENKAIANPIGAGLHMHTPTQTQTLSKSVSVSTQSKAGARSGSNGPRAPASNATIGERLGDYVWDGSKWAEVPFGEKWLGR